MIPVFNNTQLRIEHFLMLFTKNNVDEQHVYQNEEWNI